MTRSRVWTLGTAVAVVLILLAGWFLLVSPTKAKASDVEEQAASQAQANAQLASKIEQLKVQAADLPAQEAKLAKFRQKIPAQPALPSFIRSLSDISKKSHVALISLEPQTPQALSVPVAATAATTEDGAATDSGTVTLDTAPPSQVQFVQTQVTIQGGYFNTEQFLTKLEGLKRSFLVTGFDINAMTDATGTDSAVSPGDVETHLQVRVFFAPPPELPSSTATASN